MTKPERIIASGLATAGLEFIRDADLLGTPDFRIGESNVLVFVDGDFWHGLKESKSGYWRNRIAMVRGYDRKVSNALRKQGWIVVRLWEHEIMRDPRGALMKILKQIGPVKAGQRS